MRKHLESPVLRREKKTTSSTTRRLDNAENARQKRLTCKEPADDASDWSLKEELVNNESETLVE
jgi:hypothetical protein